MRNKYIVCSQNVKRFDNKDQSIVALQHLSLIDPSKVLSKNQKPIGPLTIHFPSTLSVVEVNERERECFEMKILKVLRN